MTWYLAVLNKYAVFTGRARRKEYWMFTLFNCIFSVIFLLMDMNVGTYSEATGYGLISGIYTLFVLLPSWGVSVRRLHDTGRSGWMLLIGLIPLIGAILLLVWVCQDSDFGPNNYGENPKGDVF